MEVYSFGEENKPHAKSPGAILAWPVRDRQKTIAEFGRGDRVRLVNRAPTSMSTRCRHESLRTKSTQVIRQSLDILD